MPADGDSPTPTATPTVVLSDPRDPGTFRSTDNVDVKDWLSMYERVSKYYSWDPTLLLSNVIFYLQRTAGVWFDTHEDELTSWDICKQKLRDLFEKPVGRKLAAQKELASRAQSSTESHVFYVQAFLALCIKDDMSESDKVVHILKGIADVAFNLLVNKNCAMADGIVAEYRRFEQAKSRHIMQQFTRLP